MWPLSDTTHHRSPSRYWATDHSLWVLSYNQFLVHWTAHPSNTSFQLGEKDVMEDHVKGLNEVQIDDNSSSCLVHWWTYAIMKSNSVGQEGHALGELMVVIPEDLPLFHTGVHRYRFLGPSFLLFFFFFWCVWIILKQIKNPRDLLLFVEHVSFAFSHPIYDFIFLFHQWEDIR